MGRIRRVAAQPVSVTPKSAGSLQAGNVLTGLVLSLGALLAVGGVLVAYATYQNFQRLDGQFTSANTAVGQLKEDVKELQDTERTVVVKRVESETVKSKKVESETVQSKQVQSSMIDVKTVKADRGEFKTVDVQEWEVGTAIASTVLSNLSAIQVQTNVNVAGNVDIAKKLTTTGKSTFGAQAVFTGQPTGNGVDKGSVYINPKSALSSNTIFGLAVGGKEKVRIDADGNIYAGAVITPGTTTESTEILNDLTVLQDTTLGNDATDALTVEATSTFQEAVTLNNTLDVSGTATFADVDATTLSGDGSSITALNAGNVSSGTLSDSRLSSNVTTQGNTFNGSSQLVQTTAGGGLPALNASNVTDLNASNVASGTLSDSRLSSDVTTQGNNFNSASQLVQLNASGELPALSGANLTDLNAGNVSSGTLSDSRLSSNVALLDRDNQVFTGDSQVFRNDVDSTDALEVQNAAGTAFFTLDSSALELTVTNATVTSDLSVSGTFALGSSGTAISQIRVYTPDLSPNAVSITSTEEQTYTVPGLTTNDTVFVNPPSHVSNCGLIGTRVSGTDTLALAWFNRSGVSSCTPPQGTYRIVAIRGS